MDYFISMSFTADNLKLFDTSVNLEVDSSLAEQQIFEICRRISTIFSRLFFDNKLTGIDSQLLAWDKFSLNLSIVDDQLIRELNAQYRGKDKVTDVLSFPVHEDLRRGLDLSSIVGREFLLGDIFICHSVAVNQALESGLDLKTEIAELFIHGVLHLLGYDHEISEQEKEIMYKLEEIIFDLYKELP